MPRSTVNAILNLETLYWVPDPLRDQGLESDVCVWPVFFTIDGSSAQLSATGQLEGTAAVTGTSGVGRVGKLPEDGSVVIPAEIGLWTGPVVPIPVAPGLPVSDLPGVFGAAVVVVQPSGMEADALLAGHEALNSAMQDALDVLISKLNVGHDHPTQADLDALAQSVGSSISSAVKGAMDVWDKLHEGVFDLSLFGNTFFYYSQDDVPTAAFDQGDFDPSSDAGPAVFFSGTVGYIGLNGAVSGSRREVGQGVLSHFDSPVGAVAGYADDSAFQHAIVATGDGNVTELWWQGPGGVGRGTLSHFSSGIVSLAGFYSPDGYQHVIVATSDHAVTELWWQGAGAVGRGRLTLLPNPSTALAGYYSGDGYNNVIIASQDGTLTELWWQGSGAVGQGTLAQIASPVVDLAGYWTPDNVHHVIVLSKDGSITELTWTGPAAPTATLLSRVEAWQWNNPVGVGAYFAPQDNEQHTIVAMSNNTLRELHWSPQLSTPPQIVLHDDLGAVVGIRPIIDAYFDPGGYQHAIVSSEDGNVHELWWTTPRRIIGIPVVPITVTHKAA